MRIAEQMWFALRELAVNIVKSHEYVVLLKRRGGEVFCAMSCGLHAPLPSLFSVAF